MKPEQQQIAIARVCGWKPHYSNDGFGEHPIHAPKQMQRIPNYLNDLNAMHEAEKILTLNQLVEYSHKLLIGVVYQYEAINATASQRAKAFLRTLSLWTTD